MDLTVKPGDCMRVKTKTMNDVFGECFYRIGEEKRETDKGIFYRCVMLGGSGPSAKPGLVVWDTLEQIQQNIDDGITSLVPDEKARQIEQQYAKGDDGKITGTGVQDFG